MRTTLIVFFAMLIISCQKEVKHTDKDILAAYELFERIVPGYSEQFKMEKLECDSIDVFEVDGVDDKIVLRANNTLSFASALNWYLKYTCNVHKSWCGDQMNLAKELPVPVRKYTHVIKQKYRVNFNYCTLNYSASWWNWERWEQEIDFMALNGINMPLSVIGLEAVWYNTLLKYGFSDQEARSYLVGPAYSAWQWMTNIQSHTGTLPKNWIDKRIELGKKIINRQVELGMMPIQQAFTGCVPVEMISKFPDASILQEAKWCNFPGTAQLDPLDPLFKEFGSTFLDEQKKLFGAHHFYAADPFHEGTPPQEGKEYLNKVGKSIIDLMIEKDSLSTWVMQAWSIRKEIASAVPKNQLLVLDLSGKSALGKEMFWGYDFVVGSLHNFGARINLHGDLEYVASNKFTNLYSNVPNAVGTGLFMEGIGQNPVYYDLAFEMGISSDSVQIKPWLNKYADRRYGAVSTNAHKAWKILLKTAYMKGTDNVENSSIVCARPAIKVKKSGPNAGFHIPYQNKELLQSLLLLLADRDQLQASDAFKYDVVDVLRQVLSNYGQTVQANAAKAFVEKNKEDFNRYSQEFLSLLKDIDLLLSTRSEFSFEKWVKDARSWGITDEERNYYEYNASMLVTLWGPLTEKNEPVIFDYSWREWSGLIDQYYYKRWKIFYDMLSVHLENGTDYSEENLPMVHGREAFRANEFYSKMADWEIAWVKSIKQFKVNENIDELDVAKDLLDKYAGRIK